MSIAIGIILAGFTVQAALIKSNIEETLKNNIELYNIDTAMFLIDYNLCKNIKWKKDKYNADGYYIIECFQNNKEHWIYIDELLSYYNYLSN